MFVLPVRTELVTTETLPTLYTSDCTCKEEAERAEEEPSLSHATST